MRKIKRTAVLGSLVLALALSGAAAQNAPDWVAAWATSQQRLGMDRISDATVRMIARVTLPGDAIRIRLDNTFGTAPVTFGKAMVAPRARGAKIALGANRPVTFGGKTSVTVPAGGSVTSDAVAMSVGAEEDLAVSLYVTGQNVQPSQHNNAQVTSYLTADLAGDQTASEDDKPFTGKTTSMFWLKAIDVHPTSPASAIVALGDSITDGTCSTLDAHDRWEDRLAERFALETPNPHAVINEGIGGNTVINQPSYNPPANSPPAAERLERDVFSHPGVSTVVLFDGTNDIRRGVSAANLIAGIKDVVARVHAKGLKIVGVTIIPRHISVPGIADTGWSAEKNKVRDSVNAFIRKDAGFDAVLDFDRVVRDPANPDLIQAALGCGDGVHPSPYGYFRLGKSVDLAVFGK
jgi:lysophospholipase L1-like esterase